MEATAAGQAALQSAVFQPADSFGARSIQDDNGKVVALVAQNGSVFGIPAAFLTLDAAWYGSTALAVVPADQCRVAGSPGSDMLLSDVVAQCRSSGEDGICAATMLGLYQITQQPHGGELLLQLPPSANESSLRAAPHGQASSGAAMKPWLVLLAAAACGAALSAVLLVVFWQQAAVAKHQGMPMPDSESISLDDRGSGAAVNGRARRRSGGGGSSSGAARKQPHLSNRMRGIMRQPELEIGGAAGQQSEAGRTLLAGDRAQKGVREDDGLPSTAAVAAGFTDTAMRQRRVKDGVIMVGHMRVR